MTPLELIQRDATSQACHGLNPYPLHDRKDENETHVTLYLNVTLDGWMSADGFERLMPMHITLYKRRLPRSAIPDGAPLPWQVYEMNRRLKTTFAEHPFWFTGHTAVPSDRRVIIPMAYSNLVSALYRDVRFLLEVARIAGPDPFIGNEAFWTCNPSEHAIHLSAALQVRRGHAMT